MGGSTRVRRRLMLGLFGLLAALGGLVAAARPSQAAPSGLDPGVRSFLERPGPELKRIPRAFRIIALSNLGDYVTHLTVRGALSEAEARQAFDRLLEIAQGREVSPLSGPAETAPLGEDGLYLSHLNLMFGAYARAVPDQRHRVAHQRLSRHLAAASLASRTAHIASYPGVALRWPADQAVTLASLTRADRALHTDLAEGPRAAWDRVMVEHRTPSGLPPSEITGRSRTSSYPRGCALAWTVRYQHEFEPEAAADTWRRFRDRFGVSFGLVLGFREWPRGFEGPSDSDSGPIVAGVGAAASGLALVAARAVGDEDSYALLERGKGLVEGMGADQGAAETILARAIALNAAAFTPWSGAAPL
ncbi:MAG: hypothetical protein U1E65_02685 [Myxococcota bacterium]